jgi:hypothetical protein
MEARKYRGVIPPITATSLTEANLQKHEKTFLSTPFPQKYFIVIA